MANDRLMIRCKFCAEDRTFYKYYPPNGLLGGGYVIESDSFSEWVDKHVQACNLKAGSDLGGEVTFEFYCENAALRENSSRRSH